MYIVTIDTGTTNTRVCLWDDKVLIDSVMRPVGVRNTSIEGNNQQIVRAISAAFSELLSTNQLNESNIEQVLASGMITSNLGLLEVPHVVAPVDINTLAKQMQSQVFEQICSQPIWFIPGVKNFASACDSNWEAMDMMRGEEVEAFAIRQKMSEPGPVLVVLPGSHTKFIAFNEQGQISGCCTTLAGELIYAVTHHTILSSSLDKRFAEKIDTQYLVRGANSSLQVGLTRSLFTVRVLEQSGQLEHDQLASFLLGAIVITDIEAFLNSRALNYQASHTVYVSTNSLQGQAFLLVLAQFHPQIKLCNVEEFKLSNMAGAGCILVATAAKL